VDAMHHADEARSLNVQFNNAYQITDSARACTGFGQKVKIKDIQLFELNYMKFKF